MSPEVVLFVHEVRLRQRIRNCERTHQTLAHQEAQACEKISERTDSVKGLFLQPAPRRVLFALAPLTHSVVGALAEL